MPKKRVFYFILSLVLILIITILFELKNPGCVDAQCVPVPVLVLSGECSSEAHANNTVDQDCQAAPARSICGLVKAEYEDVDDDSERGSCRVLISGGRWIVRAWVDDDADAWCKARCITW